MRKPVSRLAVVGAVLGCVIFAHASLRPIRPPLVQPQPMQDICLSNITIGNCGTGCAMAGSINSTGGNPNGQQCPGGGGTLWYLYSGSGCINSFVGCPPTNYTGLAYFQVGISKACANCIGIKSNVCNVAWQNGQTNNFQVDMPPACTNLHLYLYQLPTDGPCPIRVCVWTNGGSDRSASCNGGGSPVGLAEE
jgi:hypothetical protein